MWPLEDSLQAGNLWHIILGDSLQLYRSNLETKTIYRQCTMHTKVNQKTEISLHMAFKTAYMQVAYEKCKLF